MRTVRCARVRRRHMMPSSKGPAMPHDATSSAHEFAIFVPELSRKLAPIIMITDRDCVTRIRSVLRLGVGDQCVLFDAALHIQVTIHAIHKDFINVLPIKQAPNPVLTPPIMMFLPVLKQEDLADAVGMLTACGVSAIQLMYTEKTQRIWSDKYMLRLERLIIAAAEQSKQFKLPHIFPPVALHDLMTKPSVTATRSRYIFFDPTGMPLAQVVQKVQETERAAISLVLIVGPEGDLTVDEKELLRHHDVLFCALTKTVLRASLAATLGVGAFRSLVD
jgi:RsmE family RNA methyltransferase